jgi:transposase-like protein
MIRWAATVAIPRNGVRSKTVLTEIGPVGIEVPRDVEATLIDDCEEAAAPAYRGGSDRVVAVGTRADHGGDFGALREVCSASVSRETVSKITDQVLEEMTAWMNRPWMRGGF